jgi:hypothetical protein
MVTVIQIFAGFRRSSGERLPAVPGGLVLAFTHKFFRTNTMAANAIKLTRRTAN